MSYFFRRFRHSFILIGSLLVGIGIFYPAIFQYAYGIIMVVVGAIMVFISGMYIGIPDHYFDLDKKN